MAEAKTSGIQVGKHLQLSKAQTVTFVAAGVAVFLIVFTLVAAKSLIGQGNYQRKVISAKQIALDQLKTNQTNANQLVSSYKTFLDSPENLIGGAPSGNGPTDGSNPKLVLDALPTQYDFPALTSSLEKIIDGQNMNIKGITGQDDQVAQQSNISSASPLPVEMPFSVTAEGSYTQVQSLVGQFEHSIRPFQILTADFKGDQNDMTVTLSAQTYYQPGKNFQVRTKVIN